MAMESKRAKRLYPTIGTGAFRSRPCGFQVDPVAVASALGAAGHLGGGVAEALLDGGFEGLGLLAFT
jgi:hypothetical protein